MWCDDAVILERRSSFWLCILITLRRSSGSWIVHAGRLTIAAFAVAGSACSTGRRPAPPAPIVQPGAPGQESTVISAEKAANLSRVNFTEADVRFMQGMIGHHAQALEMTALVPSRTARDDLKKLALRIELSQVDEIGMMKHWLEARGQNVPGPHALHMHGATLMPGMLTAEEMATLTRAQGREFDRLFLAGMIKHHEGALTMVRDLYATPGAGQESEIYAFASDVDADQRMEIERMGSMLGELEK
jgi:uncharacterized protein (DUF305 family)